MDAERRWRVGLLCALPFVAIALAGARPLHEVRGHAFVGAALATLASICLRRLVAAARVRGTLPARTLALAGVLLVAPWILIALLWVGLGAPFEASATENRISATPWVMPCILGVLLLNSAGAKGGRAVPGKPGQAQPATRVERQDAVGRDDGLPGAGRGTRFAEGRSFLTSTQPIV